ncbi:hypothetical protein CPB83DRAFT_853841 [Crepidotus variabilis]|uniref:Uncharacterized protein n=1 Tax=Crepidotus variabilis TaxID=179855 RepID=A0A9P6EH57_9AGAR|nr:hypothetical protein CPB83DRAFT_853841 [Crepidotus variabilis]
MVQISNAIIITTILVAPVLAVPVPPTSGHRRQQRTTEADDHEIQQHKAHRHKVQRYQGQYPKPHPHQRPAGQRRQSTFGQVASVAGGILGAASAGAGLASLIPHQDKPAQVPPVPQAQAELQARDPNSKRAKFRKVASGAGAVFGGALGVTSTVVDVASLIPDQEAPPPQPRENEGEINVREPKVGFRKVASVAGSTMGAVSTVAGLAALIPGLQDQQPQAREYDEEIEAREPKVGFRKVASAAGSTIGAVSTVAGFAALIPGLQGQQPSPPQAREYDEGVEVRGAVRHRRHRFVNGDIATIASGLAGAAGFGGAVAIQQTARDVSYNELD